MRGSRAGFEPKARNTRATVSFGGGGASAFQLPNLRAALSFGGGGSSALATFQGVNFSGGGSSTFQGRAAIQFGGGGASFIEVNEGVATYPNGFKHFLEFLIPEPNVFGGGALNNYLGSISETLPELRTVANGGLVENASGFDMQVELDDGTVVPFARLDWDAATGRIVLRPRIASLPATGQRFRLFFGKTVVADGANEGSAYSAHLLAPNIRTGADRTGLGRTFTPAGLSNSLLGGYGATFQGTTGRLVRSNPTELHGLNAITIQALVQLGSNLVDQPIFMAGSTSTAAFAIHLRFRGSDGRLLFNLTTTSGSTQVESPDDMAPAPGTPLLVAATWSAGRSPDLFVGGRLVTPAVAGIVLNGTIDMGAAPTDAAIGFNRAVNRYFSGQMADVMVSARRLSESHLQTQERNYLTPRDCYGVGESNSASVANTSPVLPPIRTTATVNINAEVDPALIAYEADTAQVKTLDAHSGSDGGTYTIVGGRARGRFTTAGTFRSSATVRDNGAPVKRSLAPIIWAVSPASEPGSPKYPPTYANNKQRWIGGGGPAGSISHPSGESGLRAALAAVNPGEEIVLENATYPGNYDITRPGSEDNWITLRPRTHKGATFTGYIAAKASWWWFNSLTLARPGAQAGPSNDTIYERPENYYSIIMIGHHLKVTRNLIRSPNGLWVHHTANPNSIIKENAPTHHCDILGNTFTGSEPPIWDACASIFMGRIPENASGPYNIDIAFNFFNEVTDPTNDNPSGANRWSNLYVGNSKPKNNPVGNTDTNFFRNNYLVSRYDGTYFKRSMNVRQNVYDMTRQTQQAINFRHGGRSNEKGDPPTGAFAAVPTVYIEANRFLRTNRGIQVGDTDHIVRDNVWDQGQGTIRLFSGCQRDPVLAPSADPGFIQSAKRTTLVNNAGVTKHEIGAFGNAPVFILAPTPGRTDISDQGGVISGVRIFQGNQNITTGDIQLLNGATAAAYQILTGFGGLSSGLSVPTVAEAQAACGCDVP